MRREKEVFDSGSVWRSIFSMALPALVTILAMMFYNMADMFFIGQLGESATASVAAVSLISPVFSLMMAFATMIGAGGSVLIGTALGAGEQERAGNQSALCVWTAVASGALMMIMLFAAREPLLSFLGARKDTIDAARTYLSILTLGAIIMITNSACATMIRAEGAAKESLLGNLAGTAVNIVLDALLILGLRWGVAGAAAATVIGNCVSLLYYVWYILKRSKAMSLCPSRAIKSISELGSMVWTGVPNALNTVLSGFASTFSNRILADYGSNEIAAVAAAGKVNLLITMVQMGICMGVQPLISHSVGAKNVKQLGEVLKKTAILTVGVGAASAVFCFVMRSHLIRLFLKSEDAAAIGERFVLYLMAGSVFLGFYYLSSNYLQAAQRATAAIVVSTLRQGVLLIPLLYLFHWMIGFDGIGLAHTAADIGASAIAFTVFWRAYHQNRKGVIS